jgi:hypothetical protein
METARLMFGRAKSEWDVRGGGLGRPDYPELRVLVATIVPGGTNRVVVGHGHQFEFVSGVNLSEGDAAIIEGGGDSSFKVLAQIRADEWSKLEPSSMVMRRRYIRAEVHLSRHILLQVGRADGDVEESADQHRARSTAFL